MSITARDKKVLAVLAALACLAGYWFLVLGPKRGEADKAQKALTEATEKRDAAVARERQLQTARSRYATDYAAVVRLGKAVPASVDMPSLIVQLDEASKGSGIDFQSLKSGERAPASTAATSPQSGGSTPPGGKSSAPATPGGESAQSAPGSAKETAGNKVEQANANADAAAKQNGLDASDTKTSEAAREGVLPVGGGGAGGTAASPTSAAPGLDAVPLDFRFRGDFFELADFFHRLKRFVYIASGGIEVRGRLMTIDGFKFDQGEAGAGKKGGLQADVKATVYLSPKQEGVSAGATPQAPAAPGASTEETSDQPAPPAGSAAAPTATVAP